MTTSEEHMQYTKEDYTIAKRTKNNHSDLCGIQMVTLEWIIENEGNIDCRCFDRED